MVLHLTLPWTQDVILTYIRRSEDVQDKRFVNLRVVSTGVSLKIKVFFKENHLDWLSIHFFNKERTWGKPLIISSTQNRSNQAYITRNSEIHRLGHGQSLEKGLKRWAGLSHNCHKRLIKYQKNPVVINNRSLCSKRSS